jgi:hypothetical protein
MEPEEALQAKQNRAAVCLRVPRWGVVSESVVRLDRSRGLA